MILLDTHIWIWAFSAPHLLTHEGRALIQESEKVFVSSVSVWEIAIKMRLGKIDVDLDALIELSRERDVEFCAFGTQEALRTLELNLHHRDPFDRGLLAQALTHDWQLLSADSNIELYRQQVKIKMVGL